MLQKGLSSFSSSLGEENILLRHFEKTGEELLQQNRDTKLQFITKRAGKAESIITSVPGPLWQFCSSFFPFPL